MVRLAAYLRALTTLGSWKAGTGPSPTASSEELAAASGVNSATVRKDLSHLGSYGVRGVGYDVELLIAEIGRVLGAHRSHRVALVGVGNLGAALAGYPGFTSRGLEIGAILDVHPDRVGTHVGAILVEHTRDLVAVCRRESVTIGVIATPESAAQEVADHLVAAGVRSILAFSPGVIVVPEDVDLRRVDLALELQILAFNETRRAVFDDDPVAAGPTPSHGQASGSADHEPPSGTSGNGSGSSEPASGTSVNGSRPSAPESRLSEPAPAPFGDGPGLSGTVPDHPENSTVDGSAAAGVGR